MSFDFTGRVAIVTGAGGGLGFAYAQYLAEHGANVIVNDLGGGTFGYDGKPSSKVATAAAEKINALGKGKAIADGHDVSVAKNAERMVETALQNWGRIDIIVNNAGIASTEVFPKVSKEEYDLHLGVHVLGALNTMQAAWPHMMKQGYGRIINTASDSVLGFSPQATYPSMKAALIGLSRNAGLLGLEHNINVNVIMPAAFTRLSALLPEGGFRNHLEKDFQPEKLAPVVSYLCHEKCDITREIFSIGGGKFSRIVMASSDALPVDMTMESVAAQMKTVMTDDTSQLQIFKTTFDDLKNLGFSDEECQMFYDMTATQQELGPIEAVPIDSVDNVWDITIKSPVGDQFSQLVLNSSGSNVRGHVLNEEHGNQTVLDGKIENGDALVWKCKLTKPVPMTLTYHGQVDKDQNLQGKVVGTLMGKTVMDCAFLGKPVFGDPAETAKQASRQQAELDSQKKPGLLKRLFAKA
ncbi:MAG: SDR family NAD(P)-dependent oxidoreductase [Pseudomonadota bacterium]|nr:SDR family NAD(P)-dependent oxidoreductase [Pseudomonadota bacterium]